MHGSSEISSHLPSTSPTVVKIIPFTDDHRDPRAPQEQRPSGTSPTLHTIPIPLSSEPASVMYPSRSMVPLPSSAAGSSPAALLYSSNISPTNIQPGPTGRHPIRLSSDGAGLSYQGASSLTSEHPRSSTIAPMVGPPSVPSSQIPTYFTVAYPSSSYPSPPMQSPYSLPHMVPSARSPPISPSSAPSSNPMSPIAPLPSPPNSRVKACVCIGRILIYLVVIFLCALWIILCFAFVMTGYCIVGCCINFCTRRSGGCHDLPLICDGIERSTAYAHWGCDWLWSFTKHPRSDENEPSDRGPQRQEPVPRTSIPFPPPAVFHHPFRNPGWVAAENAIDGVVDGVNEVYSRIDRESTDLGFRALQAATRC
jgi:hypothetical protein